MLNEVMQHLIVITIIALILGLIFTATKWRGGLHMTFSQHAATNRWSKIFYASLFLTTLPVFLCFIVFWLMPQKQLPEIFFWFAFIAVIFQVLCTLFPEENDWKTKLHRALAGISGVAMLPLVWILAMSLGVSSFARTIAWIALGCMLAILVLMLFRKATKQWALLLQISYYSAFFLAILAATYS